jgi:hypothetical protein
MGHYAMDDSALQRENRRVALGRRLLSHGLRTRIISRLTGLTRNQLETLRHRLGVPSRTRRRGPTPSSLDMFLKEPVVRCEGAALAALCGAFELPALEQELASLPASYISLEYGERLCETYEAYRACYPTTHVELDELMMLREALAQADRVALGRCRSCRCLMLIDRFSGGRNCWHCDPAAYLEKTRSKVS